MILSTRIIIQFLHFRERLSKNVWMSKGLHLVFHCYTSYTWLSGHKKGCRCVHHCFCVSMVGMTCLLAGITFRCCPANRNRYQLPHSGNVIFFFLLFFFRMCVCVCALGIVKNRAAAFVGLVWMVTQKTKHTAFYIYTHTHWRMAAFKVTKHPWGRR